MQGFYLPNSDHYYFNHTTWEIERQDLAKDNAFLLTVEQANDLNFDKFFFQK